MHQVSISASVCFGLEDVGLEEGVEGRMVVVGREREAKRVARSVSVSEILVLVFAEVGGSGVGSEEGAEGRESAAKGSVGWVDFNWGLLLPVLVIGVVEVVVSVVVVVALGGPSSVSSSLPSGASRWSDSLLPSAPAWLDAVPCCCSYFTSSISLCRTSSASSLIAASSCCFIRFGGSSSLSESGSGWNAVTSTDGNE